MTEEEKKKMKDLEDSLAAEKKAREDAETAHAKEIEKKDALIEQKTRDIVGARKEYKKLSDMTEEEKKGMSAKEMELQKRQEEHEAEVAQFKKDQSERDQKEIEARRERAITKIAGKDPELQGKVKGAFSKIVDHDKAQTDEEIEAIATSAFNMLGIPKSDPVRDVMNGGGGGAPDGNGGGSNFADQKAGKDLSAAMGLPVEKAADNK